MPKAEDRILALAREGVAPKEIARRIGRQPSTVHSYLSLARSRGEAIPRFKRGSNWSGEKMLVCVDPPLHAPLALAAARRGITPREMAQSLLTACIEGDLIDAVMDDGPHDDPEPAPPQGEAS